MCMVNDIIEELLGLDMESKPESLWWTSTYKDEDVATLKVESTKENQGLAFHGGLRCPGQSFPKRCESDATDGENAQERLGSWWRDGYIYRAKTVLFYDRMLHGGQSCFLYRFEWQC